MKKRIMYIEHKTHKNDKGEAWIGLVEFSKSGQTVYFNDQAFKKQKGCAYANSGSSNYFDLETDEEYWISGIKKDGQDRHWSGSGKVFIDISIVDDYLKMVDFERLSPNKYKKVIVKRTDKQRFIEIEN